MVDPSVHAAPGMGFKNTGAAPPATKREVVCRVKCGAVELKLTLTQKFLSRSVRDALLEPFLKVYAKKAAAPVAFDDLVCVKCDGYPVDAARLGLAAEALLTRDNDYHYPFAAIELVTAAPASLTAGLLESMRASELGRTELLRIAEAAADVEGTPPDAYTERGCAKAFDVIGGGEVSALSSAEVRAAFMSEDAVRSVCIPSTSKHRHLIDDAIARMVTCDEKAVDIGQFTGFFAAVCAMALAPPDASAVPPDPDELPGRPKKTGNDFLDQLLDDDRITSRRVA